MGIRDVILELSDGTVGSIKEGLALLNLAREGGRLTLRDANLLNDLGLGAGLVLERLDGLTELGLVSLDGLQTLRVGLVGVVQSNLKLVDLSLELLLDAETLTLGPLLGLNGGSQGLHGAGVVLPGVVELLLLLDHTALFVKSVDGAATLTKLVKEVLDLISEVLVLPLDNIELLKGL